MVTCIESLSCLPTNPLDVFELYDVTFGTGMTTVILALIVGITIMAIYMRTRSLALLSVLGIYSIATFSAMITSQYISAQYQIAQYVIILAVASVIVMMVLKLVKE